MSVIPFYQPFLRVGRALILFGMIFRSDRVLPYKSLYGFFEKDKYECHEASSNNEYDPDAVCLSILIQKSPMDDALSSISALPSDFAVFTQLITYRNIVMTD